MQAKVPLQQRAADYCFFAAYRAISTFLGAVSAAKFWENVALASVFFSAIPATSMNQQQRAFLEEVIANPSDDTPRLIYADYLEEAGDPRGEFIRLQCELEQLDVLNPRYLDTVHRCEELWSEHKQTWAVEHSQDLRVSAFHRGFIDTVTVRARAFLKQGESLYRDMPVHWLRFNYLQGLGKQLAANKSLSKVECLDLAGLKVPDEDLIALLNSPHLTNLHALKLGSWETPVSAEIGRAISGMPSAANIQQLYISPGDGFFQAFASGVGLPQLRELSLSMTHWLHGLSELKIEKLKSLTMTGTLDQANVSTLCSLPLSEVKQLHCDMLRLETNAFGQLAEQGIFNEVEDFRFNNGDGLDVDGCEQIFRNGQLSKCKRIEVASRKVIPVETSRSNRAIALGKRISDFPGAISRQPFAHFATRTDCMFPRFRKPSVADHRAFTIGRERLESVLPKSFA